MNLFNSLRWSWWAWFQAKFYPTEEDSRCIADAHASPLADYYDYVSPTDLLAFHHDQDWDHIFCLDGQADLHDPQCGDAFSDHHADGQFDHDSHHSHHDDSHHWHDHDSSWSSDTHDSDWGSSWD